MELDNEKLSQFFQHRIAQLEDQLRQFEEGFANCINTDQNDTAAAIFTRMVVRRHELEQLALERDRLHAQQ